MFTEFCFPFLIMNNLGFIGGSTDLNIMFKMSSTYKYFVLSLRNGHYVFIVFPNNYLLVLGRQYEGVLG